MNGVEEHKKLCNILNKVYEKKNNDYGDSFSRVYKELGILSAVTQISHKYHRLTTLAKGADQKVCEESIRDTLLDMANYCLLTVMEIDKESREVDKDGREQEEQQGQEAHTGN